MKKLTLNVDALRVESFAAGAGMPAARHGGRARPAAHAHLPVAPLHRVLRHGPPDDQLLLTGPVIAPSVATSVR
jgi:hypothetical protein